MLQAEIKNEELKLKEQTLSNSLLDPFAEGEELSDEPISKYLTYTQVNA